VSHTLWKRTLRCCISTRTSALADDDARAVGVLRKVYSQGAAAKLPPVQCPHRRLRQRGVSELDKPVAFGLASFLVLDEAHRENRADSGEEIPHHGLAHVEADVAHKHGYRPCTRHLEAEL
jgi:hypothetical protein